MLYDLINRKIAKAIVSYSYSFRFHVVCLTIWLLIRSSIFSVPPSSRICVTGITKRPGIVVVFISSFSFVLIKTQMFCAVLSGMKVRTSVQYCLQKFEIYFIGWQRRNGINRLWTLISDWVGSYFRRWSTNEGGSLFE